MYKLFIWVMSLVFAGLGVLVTLLNSTPVSLDVFFYQFQWPLSWVIVSSFILGGLLTLFVMPLFKLFR